MKPLDDAGQQLAVEAVDRARRIAERYARIFPEHAEDFESSANWGVIRAASSYVPEKGEIWERWSNLCIKGEIKDFLDGSYLKRRKLWPYAALSEVAGRGGDIGAWESAESLERLLALLPPRHRELCSLVYKDDITPYSAGQALGLSGSQGCRIHQEALAYLRDALAA